MLIARSVAFVRMAFFRSRITVITQTNKSAERHENYLHKLRRAGPLSFSTIFRVVTRSEFMPEEIFKSI